MAIITIQELIDAGAHYGTKSSMWHPKMGPYIFGTRNKVHIIDLRQTVRALIQAYYYAAKLAKANKTVLFVGTKRQAKDVLRDAARAVGMPYVTERWLGGLLTNNETIRSSIKRLDAIEEEMADPGYSRLSKKKQARDMRERRRVLRNLEGVRMMGKLPDALFVIDPAKENSAVREAKRIGIPVIGLLDTDCNPQHINLPIPANDDGIRSIQSVVKVLLDGIRHGRSQQVDVAERPEGEAAATGEAQSETAQPAQTEQPAAAEAATQGDGAAKQEEKADA
ncbi:MAG: 30S ribosomal protein S2 [Planctomycetota bacterium]